MRSSSPLCRGLRRPVAGLVTFLALLSQLGCSAQLGSKSGGAEPVVERNKATTKRFFLEVMNEGRFDLINGMFTPDYTLEGQPFPDTKGWAEKLKQTYPKLKFELHGMIGEGDAVAVWWVLDLHDPNANQQRFSGINLLTFTADGRVQSNWEGDLAASVIPGSGRSAGPAYPEAWLSNNGLVLDSYSGERFQLVHDYPMSLPPKPDDPWNRAVRWPLTRSNVVAYMTALRAYVYDSLLPVDFRPERLRRGPDGQGGWYHEPWLSGIYLQSGEQDGLPTWCGRDFIRGLYFGTPLPKNTIPGQKHAYRNYEVVLYNDVGGYHLGRVWNARGNPSFGDFQFADGTVVVKLVFTTAQDQPKVLSGAPRWTAYLPTANDCKSPALTQLALIQMDIVLKDSVNSPQTGWIFTTYVYDANNPSKDPWERMVPLGAMWGDDPGVKPGGELKETAINPEAPKWFSRNLGWGDRLSGPIDLAKGAGSCLSCHATSEYSLDAKAKLESNFLPPADLPESEKMARWFRNLPGNEAWSGKQGGWMALDYSFVTLGSLAHYHARAGIRTAPSVLRDRERF